MPIRLLLYWCLVQLPLSLLAQLDQPAVDFKQVDVRCTVDTLTHTLRIHAFYTIMALEKTPSFYLDARKMDIGELRLNKRRVRYENDGRRITIHKKLKANRSYSLELDYSVAPEQTVYFIGWEDAVPGNNQIWTQGQGKYTSHWLPSLDDMNDKMIFNLEIGFDPDYTVLANGNLVNTQIQKGLKFWSYRMEHPMSSYLAAFVVGQYEAENQTSAKGVPIVNYFYRGAEDRAEPTYRYTKEMLDFLETEIGVPYPWQNYKQVPVRDFLYAGMENTGLTIYSDDYLTDSIAFHDKNYVEVNAHEMAHQWFGNLVTEQNGTHHWLHEGFATYYALLAEREVVDAETYYWKLFDKALALKKQSEEGKGEALTDPGASSVTFYDKGAWALVMLRHRVGDSAFRSGVKNFLQRYRFQNVTITQFLDEMESASGAELGDYRRKWLENNVFPHQEASDYLAARSEAVRDFLGLQHEVRTSTLPNVDILRKYWARSTSSEVKRRSMSSYFKSLPQDFIKEAFDSGDTYVRQAIALSTTTIPVGLKSEYESLLEDPSYATQEQALYLLWIHFPEDRVRYLNQMKGIEGFADRNVEQLWLLLASLTPDFETRTDRERYRQRLSAYTGSKYPFQVRQRAFLLLAEIQRMEDSNLLDLMRATVHPQYAFRSFARDLLGSFMRSAEEADRIRTLAEELKPEERRYIENKLRKE